MKPSKTVTPTTKRAPRITVQLQRDRVNFAANGELSVITFFAAAIVAFVLWRYL